MTSKFLSTPYIHASIINYFWWPLVTTRLKYGFPRDSDGCATINSTEECRNSIMFGDPNQSLLKLIAKVCSDLDIETSIYGPYKNSGNFGGEKDMYALYVRARSKYRFAELVGSNLARKREVLEKIARFYL